MLGWDRKGGGGRFRTETSTLGEARFVGAKGDFSRPGSTGFIHERHVSRTQGERWARRSDDKKSAQQLLKF